MANDDQSQKVGINIDVSKESIDKVVDSLVDTFSPIRETALAITDRVRLFRMNSAVAALNRAKQIAHEQGIALDPPDLKFLIPFLEKVSVETEDSSLHELWANLLVSEATESKQRHIRFTSILSEMGSIHADILRKLVVHNREHFNYMTVGHLFDVEFHYGPNSARYRLSELGSVAEDEIEDIAYQVFEIPGVCLDTVNVAPKGTRGEKGGYSVSGELFKDPLRVDFSILQSLGLIAGVNTEDYEFDKWEVNASYYTVTNLGVEFIKSCYRLSNEDPLASIKLSANE